MSAGLGMRSMLAVSLGLHLAVATGATLGERAGEFSPAPRSSAGRVVVVALIPRAEESTPPAPRALTARTGATPALKPGSDSAVLAQTADATVLGPSNDQLPLRVSSDSVPLAPIKDEPVILRPPAMGPAMLARVTAESSPRLAPAGDGAMPLPPIAVAAVAGLAPGESLVPPLVGVDEALIVPERNGDAASADEAPPSGELAILRNPSPRYPLRARRRGLEGRIVIEVEVLESGAPGRLWVMTSSGHRVLDRAALAAVRRWAFRPLLRDGRPARTVVRVPIRFELGD